LDTAWPEPSHIWRGVDYMGKSNVNVIRVDFPIADPLVNGDWPASKNSYFDSRLEMAKPAGDTYFTMLPDTEPGVNPWFKNGKEIIPERWVQAMAAAQRHYGKKMLWVEPFNEPDYGWGQGTVQNLNDILKLLPQQPEFAGTQMAGPSTLNDDAAETWYQPLKQRLQRGTTHTLAGNFDNYVGFIRDVMANGQISVNPEVHNVVEVIIGAEYGLQSVIWWGTAERTRGEFVQAQKGERLAYAEDRPRWSAAAVYRAPSGAVQAFLGTSERMGMTTNYRLVSRDRDVWYNGIGPRRDETVAIGPNQESVTNITWGRDVPPPLSGRYVIVNRLTHKVLSVSNAAKVDGAPVVQADNVRGAYQQWDVSPIVAQYGDTSYYIVSNVNSGKSLDMTGWSAVDGGPTEQWGYGTVEPQQWYFEYAGNNDFCIRSRWSTKCLEAPEGSARGGEQIRQASFTGAPRQRWRLVPVSAWPIKFTPPHRPVGLTASTRPLAVALQWTANPDIDLAGYTVFRSATPGGPYETIARGVRDTHFVDNEAREPRKYYYAVCAVDHSLNQSSLSASASAASAGGRALSVNYRFAGNLSDSSGDGNDGVSTGSPAYATGPNGARALDLNGTDASVRLPADVANSADITVAAWVFCDGGAQGQRIFDLGNDESDCLYLTPNSGEGTLRLAVRYGGKEQRLDAPPLPEGRWVHVAATLGKRKARLYVNGALVAQSESWTAGPVAFRPVFNYLGKSESDADPLFAGRISDFRIYNYALTCEQVARLAK
jgi:hypothetical protein